MGTSLNVYPFAGIPESAKAEAKKVVFNLEKVGYYKYDKRADSSLFIKGKTDENILKFLKDMKLYDEFEKFIKEEYGEKLKDIIGGEKKLMNVKDLEEKNKFNKVGEEIAKMKLRDSDGMK